MVTLRKIGVLSLAKIEAIIMIIIGLIIGIFSGILSSLLRTTEYATESTFVLGWWAVIVFPIFYGLIGFIGGAIGALLYNLIAGWVGGVELDLRK